MPTPEQLLKSECQDRCAEYGDPPCYELVEDPPSIGPWRACADCLNACGFPPDPEPLDPAAVVRPLI